MAAPYLTPYRPPTQPRRPTSALALAAAGTPTPANPFGFRTARNTTGFAEPSAPASAPVARRPVSAATSPIAPPVTRPTVNPAFATPQAPPTPGGYDITTDPALQQVNALTGMSDEEANAEALRQRQQQALGYGDAGLARSLGLGEDVATAAGANPTSTLAQLRQQHDRNAKTLTDELNAANLLYSGYRITEEEQAAQDYENQLAGAAGGVNANLGTISANLVAALTANREQRAAALQQAADRALQSAIASGGAGGLAPAAAGGGGSGSAAPPVTAPTPTAPTPEQGLVQGVLTGLNAAPASYPVMQFTGPAVDASDPLALLFGAAAPVTSPYGSTAQRRRQAL